MSLATVSEVKLKIMSNVVKKKWLFSDYDAPLSEAGDYTPKYSSIKDNIGPYLAVQTSLPAQPAESVKRAFPSVQITSYLTVDDLVNQVVWYYANAFEE